MRGLKKQLCAALEGRMKGRKVPVPDAGGPLLDGFLALSCGPVVPNPITWEAMAGVSQVMRVNAYRKDSLRQHREADALRDLIGAENEAMAFVLRAVLDGGLELQPALDLWTAECTKRRETA